VGRFEIRDRIGRLDPERDYAEIYRLMVFYEYPWDLRMVGKTMIWHLYAVPSTASVVGSTDDLTNRAEETSLVFGELIEHGLDSARGRATLRMINRSHRGWPISDEDHRYALAALAVTAIRWLDRYAWRKPSPNERAATVLFYAELGRRIGVSDLPRSYPAVAEYLAECERDRIAYSPIGQRVSERTIEMARSRTPGPLAPLVGPVISALLDPPVRAAVGLPVPPRAIRWALRVLLYVRPKVVRWLPPRREPTTPHTRRGYPRRVSRRLPLSFGAECFTLSTSRDVHRGNRSRRHTRYCCRRWNFGGTPTLWRNALSTSLSTTSTGRPRTKA